MKKGYLKSLLFSVLCGFYAFTAPAAVSLFSDYGQIQNVQFYSSNPFWKPNSPYNQRVPQPVYAQGADLTAGDCFDVVQPLVAAQCTARNDCKNTSLSDIRPVVMVQLSTLPNHNYVSACAGYIDGIFESYVNKSKNVILNQPTPFPAATVPNPDMQDTDDGGGEQVEKPQNKQMPAWQQEIQERTEELRTLQSQNGADSYMLSAADFPKTYADVSFEEYMENAKQGYLPFKDKNGYRTLELKDKKEYCDEHSDLAMCQDKKKPKPSFTRPGEAGTESEDNEDS